MSATVQEIFNQFTSIFGHKVIKRRQEEWEQSSEGWDTHALRHMTYWILRDRQQLDHNQAAAAIENLNIAQLKQKLFTLAPELNKTINTNTSKSKIVNPDLSVIEQELAEISNQFNQKEQPLKAKSQSSLNQPKQKQPENTNFLNMQDFAAKEYPDCIRDILGDNYGFTAIKKLQESWQYVQQTNPDVLSMSFNIAKGWASLIMDEFEQQLAHPNLTKIEIFNQLNLALLTDAGVILRKGETGTFIVHVKGEQLTPDNGQYWQAISYNGYAIIRMLMVETIWRDIH